MEVWLTKGGYKTVHLPSTYLVETELTKAHSKYETTYLPTWWRLHSQTAVLTNLPTYLIEAQLTKAGSKYKITYLPDGGSAWLGSRKGSWRTKLSTKYQLIEL
jgi:hypothetical protein